jgi:outer membrane lipoprotein-sorting protein
VKRQTKQIAAVLLVLAAVLISGCTGDMSADQIAARMEAKQESIEDFSATMVMTSFAGETETTRAKIMTKMPDKTRSEYIEPAGLAGTVRVTNGSTMWTYNPARKQVTKVELPEDMPSEMDYTELVKNILDENDISLEGIENVGGRSAYVIGGTSGDEADREFISRTRVWVDRENWMLLGIEMYDKDDNLVSKVEYRDITFNTGIPDSEFIFEAPVGAEVVERSFDRMPMTLDEARANTTFDLKTPSYLPEGYEFDHAMFIGSIMWEVVSLQYTNGDARLHLSEWVGDDSDRSEPTMVEPEIVSINGTDGELTSMFGINTLRWSADGIGYSLSGEFEQDELVKVAESLV